MMQIGLYLPLLVCVLLRRLRAVLISSGVTIDALVCGFWLIAREFRLFKRVFGWVARTKWSKV
jgi:hypothetical protein